MRVPGRHISLNLTAPSQLRRPLTVLGGSHSASGSNLCLLGDKLPLLQRKPSISEAWIFKDTFDGLILKSLSLHRLRIVEKIS